MGKVDISSIIQKIGKRERTAFFKEISGLSGACKAKS
jgi:hypothetical protein